MEKAMQQVQVQAPKSTLGDQIWERATRNAAYINQTEFMTSVRTRSLPVERYVDHISGVYPIVVGFNRALIRSMSKLDNVRQASLVSAMTEQLQEEQLHNRMWRQMLECFDVDHAGLYSRLRAYYDAFSRTELDLATQGVIKAVMLDRDDVAPKCFPEPVFPEPVLAMYHHMFTVATDDAKNFWFHFANQSSMEATICDFVTKSFFPGVSGHPELDRGDKSTNWWKEHAIQQGGGPDQPRSTEEKHLAIARHTINRSREAPEYQEAILSTVDQTLHLFAACYRWFDADLGNKWQE